MQNKGTIKVVEISRDEAFEQKVNDLVSQGYEVNSSGKNGLFWFAVMVKVGETLEGRKDYW